MVAGPGRAPKRAHNRHPQFTQQIPFCRKTQDRAIQTWFTFFVFFRRFWLDADGSGPGPSTKTSTQQAHNKHTTEPFFVVKHRTGPAKRVAHFFCFFVENLGLFRRIWLDADGGGARAVVFWGSFLNNVYFCRGWRSKKITRQAQNKHPRFTQQSPVLS